MQTRKYIGYEINKEYIDISKKKLSHLEQKIIIGDCIEKLKKIDAGSIIVTSPPYNIGKKYGKYNDSIDSSEWENLIDIQAKRILKDNGSFFLNVSPVPDKKTKEIIPLDAICYFIGKEK